MVQGGEMMRRLVFQKGGGRELAYSGRDVDEESAVCGGRWSPTWFEISADT